MSRWLYYFFSIFTLARGVRNWLQLILLLLGRSRQETILELRSSRGLPGLRFSVRSFMDAWIIKETCLDRDYEKHGTTLQDGWHIVDIGAGLGDFTIFAAQRCPHGYVYAYEPFPESFALLRRNLELNNISNVQAVCSAISGRAVRSVPLYQMGEAVQHTTTLPADKAATLKTTDTISLTLDQVCAALPQCDFMKMDCEGAEYDILLNASAATLAKIKRLSMEVHEGLIAPGRSRQELVDHLRRNGFQVTLTPNPVHAYLGFLYAAHIAHE